MIRWIRTPYFFKISFITSYLLRLDLLNIILLLIPFMRIRDPPISSSFGYLLILHFYPASCTFLGKNYLFSIPFRNNVNICCFLKVRN